MQKCQLCNTISDRLYEIAVVMDVKKTFFVCAKCKVTSQSTICPDCKSYIGVGYAYSVDKYTSKERHICGNCRSNYGECRQCGNLVTVSNLVAIGGSLKVCSLCAKNTKICMSCRNIYNIRDFTVGDIYCKYCRKKKSQYYCGVCDADFRPIPVFYGESPYYGIELEVDEDESTDEWEADACIEELNSLITSSKGRFFLKEDASLCAGFEIVSQPHSMEEWEKQTWLEEACKQVVSYGGVSFKNHRCGFHIHRSRKDLLEITIVKLLTLFIKLQPFFEKVAQRKSNGYCKFSFLGIGGTEKITGKLLYDRIKKQDNSLMDRYMALNITGPATIECRMFRGSLVYSTILAYLKFFHLLCEFSKQREVSLRSILGMSPIELWRELCKYFERDSELMVYLTEKKVLLRDCIVKE